MNAKLKKGLLIAGVVLFILAATFGTGVYQGYKIAMDKYSADLAEAGKLYRESELTNQRLTISNTELTRLNKDSQVTIDKLSQSLSAASVGIGNIKDGNGEAKELLRQLNDILQSVESSQ